MPSNPFSVADLRAKVRSRADMVNSPFVSEDEVLEFINSGWDTLHALLVNVFEDFQLVSTQSQGDIQLLAGVDAYSLSALNPVPYKLRGVDVNVDGPNGRFVPLQTFEWADRGSYPPGPNSFAGSKIRVWYTAKNTPLSDANPQPAGTIAALPDYIQNDWAELIVLEAAILCAAKEEGMAGNIPILKGLRDQKETLIRQSAPRRDSSAPQVATRRADIRRGWDRYGALPRLRPWGRAAALKYRFEAMEVRVLGGIWY